MSETRRWLAFGCTHAPDTDEAFMEFVLAQIREHRPHTIVHTGDWFEADTVSRFKSRGIRLADEYSAVFTLANTVRSVGESWGADRFIWIEGNHDWNLRDWERTNKSIADLTDYRNHYDRRRGFSLGEELENWEWHEYVNSRWQVAREGQVTFAHGFATGVTADENMSMALGMPYGLYVGTHTHRPRAVTQVKKGSAWLPYWFANAGTGRDLDNVHYMRKFNRDAWGQAVVVGDAATWRYDKTMMPQQPLWTAETRIFQMYHSRQGVYAV